MSATPPTLRDHAVRLMAVGEATADGAEWEVLRVGPVVDPDGTLVIDITAELAQEFADGVNAMAAAGLDIPIDFAHESERSDGDGSHATLGIVTGARFDAASGKVYATKRLNALGRARLAADAGDDGKGVSLRTSPTLRVRPLSHPSEPGKVIATAWMSSLAVTDRPRQNGLAAISLSRDGVTALLARYEGPDGSEAAHRQALAAACAAALQARGLYPADDGYMSVVDWSTEAAIVEVWAEDAGCTIYRIPYTEAGDTITTGAPEQVERRVIYESKPAASVAVQMSRPAGASAGGATVAEQPQATNETTPGTDAPAPDKVTLAQVREERDALLLARDEAVAQAEALKVELAQAKAAADVQATTLSQLGERLERMEAVEAERAKAEAERKFDAAFKLLMSKSNVVAASRDDLHAQFERAPDATLACMAVMAKGPGGAVGITLGAPAGSPGEAADAPKDDDAKETPATVARLCRQRAVDNGTDFDTEYAAWLRGRKEVA